MKNSLLKKTGLFCLSFFLFTCTTLPKEVAPLVYNGGRQNVILMIGDGMGLNHIKAAQVTAICSSQRQKRPLKAK